MGNTYGSVFRVTTFGESHGSALGAIIDGCPAGIALPHAAIQRELDRRRPGQSSIASARGEADHAEILSGVQQDRTLGTPIAIVVRNRDARPADYAALTQVFRPSHADFTTAQKYGVRPSSGGGRASARETVARVAAGAVARQYLAARTPITLGACVVQVGGVVCDLDAARWDLQGGEGHPVRCVDAAAAARMQAAIEAA
ncbi:MAG: chorismate synthase, partial [Deltaproteobacteria bacterium]